MRLAAKILLILLSTVVLFTIAASYFSVQSAYEQFRREQQQLASQVAQQLHRRVAAVWRSDGLPGLIRLLDEMALSQKHGVSVRWVWFEPNASADQLPHGRPEAWSALQAGQMVSISSHDPRGHRLLHTYVPLQTGSGRRGGLEITESLAQVELQVRQTTRQALVSIGGLALVCIAVAYWAGVYWVVQPLEALIDKTRRIGEGDFTQPLELPGKDELSQLANAVNQMCDKIASQQTRIVTESTQRIEALQQLRHADRLKTVGRLAAGLAHELGTPLNVVAGRAGLIASGKLTSDEVTSSALTIKSETDRITGIVQRLLDFARQRPPEQQPTDLAGLIQRTLQLLESFAAKKRVELVCQHPESTVVAAVDSGQMQQVITNVVMNAIQAMDQPGTVSVVLAVTDAADQPEPHPPGWACISVRDEGPGVAPDVREHIFEPFFTTKDVGQGTGLGLSIAYGIVQEHGGRIELANEPDRGARFDIYIPMEKPQ